MKVLFTNKNGVYRPSKKNVAILAKPTRSQVQKFKLSLGEREILTFSFEAKLNLVVFL